METERIREIEKRLRKHRDKSYITCPEDCPCWDLVILLREIKNEKKGGD